jgi:predicted transcriptional regulator YdeE
MPAEFVKVTVTASYYLAAHCKEGNMSEVYNVVSYIFKHRPCQNLTWKKPVE